jgi:hypothetical protein
MSICDSACPVPDIVEYVLWAGSVIVRHREVKTYALRASTAFTEDNSKKRNASPEDHLDLGIGSPPGTALG